LANERFFAVMCTTDIARATEWYSRLFDRRPDRQPMPSLSEWHGQGGFQLLERADRAGQGFLTLMVDDIDQAREMLLERGLDVGKKQEGDVAGIAQLNDPDGNTVTLAAPGR
jgi:predicted enzyme related to lactoylglutathione lyase